MERDKILVEVWFYENARNAPPFGTVYRPHFLVKGRSEDKDYLGIQFENLEKVSFGKHITGHVFLLYDGIDYSALKPNVNFEIKEGNRSVGEGFVIR